MELKAPSSKSRKKSTPAAPYLNFGPSGPAVDAAAARCIAYIDGGSRGNPGIAGYGVYILDDQEQPLKELYGFLGVRTNNYAEYSALLAALRFALQHGCKDLQVYSDSELLVRQITGVYKVRHPDMKALYDEAQSLIRQLDRFSIQHVYRSENKEADRLANKAMDERASSEP